MAQFVRHEGCPVCGSKNNVGVWDDGHKHCFSQGCNYFVRGDSPLALAAGKKFFRMPPINPITEFIRGISPTTFQKFWVGIDYYSGVEGAITFTYFDNANKIIGAKYRDIQRWEEKRFWQKGDTRGLFGLQCANKTEGVIIFEGEFDALAGYEMYGIKYSCLSVAHGANGAKADIIKHLEWLESTFGKIFICFDNDDPGKSAGDEVMELFRPGKAYRVVLPATYKDANEMLINGDTQLFRDAIDSAKAPIPDGFVDPDELIALALQRRDNPDFYRGESFGFEKLDYYTGGVKEDEIIIITGDTGIGKTAFVRQLAYNLLSKNTRVCWISLEMPPLRVLEQFVENHLRASYHINGVLQHPPEAYRNAEDYLLKDKGLVLYQNFGAMDSKKICDRMIHAHLAFGCKVFVIDHLAIMTSDKEWKEIDALMSAINDVVIQYHLCVLAVAQYSSNGNIRGSKGQDQIASCVLALERDHRTTVLKVFTKKPHRYVPAGYGEFFFAYDKKTKWYEEIGRADAKEISQRQINQFYQENPEEREFSTFTSRIKQRIAESSDRQQIEVEGELRTTDSKSEPECQLDIRTTGVTLDCDTLLQARLQVYIKERQAYLSGVEGLSESGRSDEDTSSEETEFTHRFEDYVRKCEQPFNSKPWFDDIWGLGGQTQN